jgi:hypothetical protein
MDVVCHIDSVNRRHIGWRGTLRGYASDPAMDVASVGGCISQYFTPWPVQPEFDLDYPTRDWPLALVSSGAHPADYRARLFGRASFRRTPGARSHYASISDADRSPQN